MPKRDLLSGLNPEQKKAVTTTQGPLLVLAGAGTGKTKVITVRIAHLLEKRVKPDAVLAMTFTNKAAAEMRERVAGLVGKKRAEKLTIGTFHAFCLRRLREFQHEAGFPRGFSICDASDQVSAVRGALRDLRVPDAAIQPGVLQSRISLLKNRLVTPEQAESAPGDDTDDLVARAYRRYEEHLRRARLLDFDDLLLFTLRLLREDDAVREALRERYRYVLVDEYQDTNGPQYEIVRQIAGGHRNLCVVGDDDQSIYSWRGADVRKILAFEKDYPGCVTVRLETNYRSTQEILDAANRVIRNNPARHDKSLKAALGRGELVNGVCSADETAEAEFVVRDLMTSVRAGKDSFGDVAILFRTQTQPRAFEAELRARGVPYVLVGGMSFFDRKEVRDVLAYLKLCANPRDEVSLLRIVNCPPRGVGKATLDRALAFATEHGIQVADAFDRADEVEGLNPTAVAAVQRLRERLAAHGAEDPGRELVSFVRRVIDDFSYEKEIERCYPDPQAREQRMQAIGEILNFAENHVSKAKSPSLEGFLSELTLSANDDRTSEDAGKRNAVTLMTLHAAKGLEFPRVYLVGLEEGLLPHARAVAEDGVEEERRLMYVGVTRARRSLTLSWASQRAKFGTKVACHPSRFLFEMKDQPPPPDWVPASAERGEGAPARKKKAKRRKTARRKKAIRRKP